MSDVSKHESTNGHGSYEHRDWVPSSVIYFLLTLGVVTVICLFGIQGLYSYLDRRARAEQPAVNPLVTNVPADTRHITPGYPQTAFPSPKLEESERDQLNGFLTNEQQQLYTYGWVDQKAGVMHIPIERAMDLLVQRGLPVRSQDASASNEKGELVGSAKENSAAKRR